LSKVLDENKFEPHNVYNAGATLITVRVAVNATGNCAPPMFVFPRKKNFHNYFFRDGPIGYTLVGNGSGYMQEQENTLGRL
jgi:hypothetical protein